MQQLWPFAKSQIRSSLRKEIVRRWSTGECCEQVKSTEREVSLSSLISLAQENRFSLDHAAILRQTLWTLRWHPSQQEETALTDTGQKRLCSSKICIVRQGTSGSLAYNQTNSNLSTALFRIEDKQGASPSARWKCTRNTPDLLD